MKLKECVWVVTLVLLASAGCLLIPEPRGDRRSSLPPPLPPIVVLGAEPYYVHEGYHYYYRDGGWAYAHSQAGPWVDLPRNRYPREVRLGHEGGRPGPDQNPGIHGHNPPGHR